MLLAACLIACAPAFARAWYPGEICRDLNLSASSTEGASTLLSGKHLRVSNTEWRPYAWHDATSPSGWRGYDFDVLDQLSWLLNFTYEVEDLGSLASGNYSSWTELLVDKVWEADLVLSYWVPDQERASRAVLLRGHLDLSTVFVAQREVAHGKSLNEYFTSWARPFDWSLWLAVVALVVVSGLVDWLTEITSSPGLHITSCLYEYCAGMLWGGFEQPLSRSSAVYQIVLAFIFLVMNASFTANLAAFITASYQPRLSAESVESLQASQQILGWYGGEQDRFATQFPRVPWEERYGDADALINGNVDAMIMNMPNYLTLRTEPRCCHFEIAQTMFAATGGWASNFDSGCVRQAIDWGLYQLTFNGTIDSLERRHFPAAPCAADDGGGARRLSEAAPGVTGWMEALLSRFRSDSASDAGGRRLQQRGTGQVAAAAASSSSDDDKQMHIDDFVGIFVLWGVTTIFVLLPFVSVLPSAFRTLSQKLAQALQPREWPTLTVDEKTTRTAHPPSADHAIDPATGLPVGIDVNNENMMLRELLRQMHDLHGKVSELTPASVVVAATETDHRV